MLKFLNKTMKRKLESIIELEDKDYDSLSIDDKRKRLETMILLGDIPNYKKEALITSVFEWVLNDDEMLQKVHEDDNFKEVVDDMFKNSNKNVKISNHDLEEIKKFVDEDLTEQECAEDHKDDECSKPIKENQPSTTKVQGYEGNDYNTDKVIEDDESDDDELGVDIEFYYRGNLATKFEFLHKRGQPIGKWAETFLFNYNKAQNEEYVFLKELACSSDRILATPYLISSDACKRICERFFMDFKTIYSSNSNLFELDTLDTGRIGYRFGFVIVKKSEINEEKLKKFGALIEMVDEAYKIIYE